MMELDLKGKRALVVGGSEGLGLASACSLAVEGVELLITARRPGPLAEAASIIHETCDVPVHSLPSDVGMPEDCKAMVDAAVRSMGGLDILVTNTGGPKPGRFFECEEDDWFLSFNTTLMNIVRLVRHAGPLMQKEGWGRIINIASLSARQPIGGLSMSNTFRPAILGLSKDLSDELGPSGVTVNTICPGMHRTGRLRHLAEARGAEDVEGYLNELGASLPVGRVGEPSQFGRMVAFLASPHAGFITGQAIGVDGGAQRAL